MKKGWKNTDKNLYCKDFKFEIGKSYHQKGKIELCENGFHFHENRFDIFKYYARESIVLEVEASGKIITGDDKSVCSDIKIIRIVPKSEALELCNLIKNSGYWNSGNRNSGNRNSGNRNSGNSNSGDSNSGDWNSGYWNSGDSNSGNSNSGDRNSGNRNSGNSNSGYSNSGYRNSGNRNSGNSNSGNSNSGDRNSGYWNSGYWNSGNRNSGNRNSGNRNSGNSNSGYWNSGDSNSGYWNSSNMNNGYFNTKKVSVIMVFNRPCSVKRWEKAIKPSFIHFDLTIWIDESKMSDQDKIDHPEFYCTQGYLKTLSYKEAWRLAWNKKNPGDIKLLEKLPNFNWKIFTKISGIKKP